MDKVKVIKAIITLQVVYLPDDPPLIAEEVASSLQAEMEFNVGEGMLDKGIGNVDRYNVHVYAHEAEQEVE